MKIHLKTIRLSTWFFLVLFSASCFGNNVNVSNISLSDPNTSEDYIYVNCDLSWENSWKDVTNHDATWLFVKYKPTGGAWAHATLNNDGHSLTNNNGVAATLVTSTDGKGIFAYRTNNGSGSNNWQGLKLRWNYGLDGLTDASTVTVKVFAIEMVYVPGTGSNGSYIFCDYGSEAASDAQAAQSPDISPDGSYVIQNANWRSASDEGGYIIDSGGKRPTGTPAGWPNGNIPFYIMKYEVSEQQWVDFFNTLTFAQKSERDITGSSGKNSDSEVNRNTISWSSGDASTSAGTRACNFLGWDDLRAFASWAALRPMTEMEYEKSCRGNDNPGTYPDFAWGTNNESLSVEGFTGTDGSGTETATNTEGTPNCNFGWTDNDPFFGGLDGPVRCGIFATSTSDRWFAGAGYYGALELSGNLWEQTLNCAFNSLPNHGDGNASYSEENWPHARASSVGQRGGSCSDPTQEVCGNEVDDNSDGLIDETPCQDYFGPNALHVSFREEAYTDQEARTYDRGIRLVRTSKETYYYDEDGDGFYEDGAASIITDSPAYPYTALQGGDCDDTLADVNPTMPELCGDNLDNDCDGKTDEPECQ